MISAYIKSFFTAAIATIVSALLLFMWIGVPNSHEDAGQIRLFISALALGIGIVVYYIVRENNLPLGIFAEDESFFEIYGDEYGENESREDIIEQPEIIAEPIPEHPALAHILLYGGAGQGKSALVQVTANELSLAYGHTVEYIEVSPGQIRSKRDLDEIILRVAANPYCALFIDEIHGLPRTLSECLYKALQDFKYDITLTREVILPEGYSISFNEERGVQTIDLPRFTCFGATTDLGEIAKPLKDRFNIRIEVSNYDEEELMEIIDITLGQDRPDSFDTYAGQENAIGIINTHIKSLLYDGEDVVVPKDAKMKLAKLSWKTARLVKQRTRNCLDYAKSIGESIVTPEIVDKAMAMFGISAEGFDRVHRDIIVHLVKQENRAVGSQALANAVGVQKEDIENVYLPELERSGVMTRDGRSMKVLSEEAYDKYSKQLPS